MKEKDDSNSHHWYSPNPKGINPCFVSILNNNKIIVQTIGKKTTTKRVNRRASNRG